jgi:hypothetical protein
MVEDPAYQGFATLKGFSLANGDALDVAGLLSFNHVSANAGGVEFALLNNVTTTFAALMSHNALHLS